MNTIRTNIFALDTAQAHVLKSQGSVGAVLHIEPEDDPIAKAPTTLYFEVKDKEGNFQASTCICTVKVYQGNEEIAVIPGQEAGNSAITAPVTFPARDIYTVVFEGKPLLSTGFNSFSLSYDIRVSRIDEGGRVIGATFLPLLVIIPIMVVLALVVIGKKQVAKKDAAIESSDNDTLK